MVNKKILGPNFGEQKKRSVKLMQRKTESVES